MPNDAGEAPGACDRHKHVEAVLEGLVDADLPGGEPDAGRDIDEAAHRAVLVTEVPGQGLVQGLINIFAAPLPGFELQARAVLEADKHFEDPYPQMNEGSDGDVLGGHAERERDDEADPRGHRIPEDLDVDVAKEVGDALEHKIEERADRDDSPARVVTDIPQPSRLERAEVLGDRVHQDELAGLLAEPVPARRGLGHLVGQPQYPLSLI